MKNRSRLFWVIILLFLLVLYWFRNSQQNPQKGPEPIDRTETRIILTKHARCRMDCRHIDLSEVREILQKGTINYQKSEPEAKPDPKYALEGLTHEGQEVRIIFAPTNRGMVVVTVIDLDREWQCNCN